MTNQVVARDARYCLTQWGIWAYQQRNIRLYYMSQAPFARFMDETYGPDEKKHERMLEISADECLDVDRAVSRLRLRYPQAWEFVGMHYLLKMSYGAIGRETGTHKQVVANVIDMGRAFVDGVINGSS